LGDSVLSKYNYQIYYDLKEFDNFTFTVHLQQGTLEQLFSKIFSNTNYKYSIDTSNNVFISLKGSIKTILPTNLFLINQYKQDTFSEQNIYTYGAINSNEKLKINVENKRIEIGKNVGRDIGKAILTGYIKDINNGGSIAGASIYVDTPFINTQTDQYGYYSITLPKGTHTLKISSMGKKELRLQIGLHENGKLNVELTDYVENLKEVVVYNKEKMANVRSLQMGVVKLNNKTIKS
jgi:hypothetical protein